MDKEEHIINALKIYDSYPPLTSRIICQLNFLKTCLNKISVKNYLFIRNIKYNKQLTIIRYNIKFNKPTYFKAWLSGFIEAEGCFSVKKTKNNHSFSIGQKNDKYILESIKEHFNISNQIRQINNNFWFVEVYKKSVLTNIINHLNNYPLLGEKQLSFKKFKDLFK